MKNQKDLKVALLGRKLSHSFSPQIHALLADYEYRLQELEPEVVGGFLQKGEFDALNVTIPYKKTVMPYLAEISEQARKIGSVNTITRTENGLRGDNTDYYGFSFMLRRSGIEVEGKKVLVLGSGGASVTVKAVLADLNAGQIITVSRSGENNYDNISVHYDAEVIVNTTPVGMYPENGKAAVCLDDFKACEGVLDLIYNPARTKLLCDAKRLGIKYANGLSMLVAQAKLASELFMGCAIPDEEIDRVLGIMEAQSENIVLVGMPGSGKSTAGRALAKKLGREFVDTDSMVEAASGITIPEIFEKYGEDEFRKREHFAACEAGKRSSLVIATGGGIIKREENYIPLSQNSKIVFLDRDINTLPVDGRPLSQANPLEKLYEERLPLYIKFSDAKAQCEPEVEKTVQNILDALEAEGRKYETACD